MKDEMDERIGRVICSLASKKKEMAMWNEEMHRQEVRKKVLVRRWRVYGLSAAASLAIVFGVGFSLFRSENDSESFEFDFSQPVYRAGSSDFGDIVSMIESGKYGDALHAINEAMADTVIDPSFTSEHREYLRSLNAVRSYELTWLKIATLVKSGKEDDAIKLLEIYKNEDGVHRDEAIELYNSMQR